MQRLQQLPERLASVIHAAPAKQKQKQISSAPKKKPLPLRK
nr:MAG TPA: hypothetical protein [Caudoviricetes sp.]